MAKENVIDLSCIRPVVSEKFLNYTTTKLVDDKDLRSLLYAEFNVEKTHTDNIFDQWFDQANSDTFQQVDEFVDTVLKDDTMFPKQYSSLPQAVSFIMSIQPGDHAYTLNKLERHLKAKSKYIKTLRLKPSLAKRKDDVTQLLEGFENAKQLVVIIEQTGTWREKSLRKLIDRLYNMLIDNPVDDKRILVIFCMSGNFRPISALLPIEVKNRLHFSSTIINESKDLVGDLQQNLLSFDSKVKLGYRLMNAIYDEFIMRDPSLTNLKYLYQYCIFKHYQRETTIFSLDKKNLLKFLKTKPNFINILKGFKSIKNQTESINWKSLNNVVDFCSEKIKELENYHLYITMQLNYYLELLMDETGNNFASDLFEIYKELMTNDDLANSIKFVDAIQKVRSIPRGRILKRIESALKHHVKLPSSIKDEKNVHTIFLNYRGKFENNDDSCDDIKKQFIKALLKQAQELKNPCKLPLSECLYYDDVVVVKCTTSPSTRVEVFENLEKETTHYETILKLILNSSDDISVADLFEDFKESVKNKLLENQEQGTKRKSPEVGKVEKITKKARKSVNFSDDKSSKRDQNNEDDLMDHGLIKAIFIDIIDCMEYQGLVKRNMTKRGFLKRCVWI